MFESCYVYLTLYHVPLLSIIVFDDRDCPGFNFCLDGVFEIFQVPAVCVCSETKVNGGASPIGGCCIQNSDCISGNCDTSTEVNPNGGINYRCVPATSGIEVEPL